MQLPFFMHYSPKTSSRWRAASCHGFFRFQDAKSELRVMAYAGERIPGTYSVGSYCAVQGRINVIEVWSVMCRVNHLSPGAALDFWNAQHNMYFNNSVLFNVIIKNAAPGKTPPRVDLPPAPPSVCTPLGVLNELDKWSVLLTTYYHGSGRIRILVPVIRLHCRNEKNAHRKRKEIRKCTETLRRSSLSSLQAMESAIYASVCCSSSVAPSQSIILPEKSSSVVTRTTLHLARKPHDSIILRREVPLTRPSSRWRGQRNDNQHPSRLTIRRGYHCKRLCIYSLTR